MIAYHNGRERSASTTKSSIKCCRVFSSHGLLELASEEFHDVQSSTGTEYWVPVSLNRAKPLRQIIFDILVSSAKIFELLLLVAQFPTDTLMVDTVVVLLN